MAVKDITIDAMAILVATAYINWFLHIDPLGSIICDTCNQPIRVHLGRGRLVIRCKQCNKGIYFRSEGG